MRTFRMRAHTLAVAACMILSPALATAHPSAPSAAPPPPPRGPAPGQYAPPPPPPSAGPGFFYRKGFTLGFGFGLGGMATDTGAIECIDCDYDPVAGAFDFHVGGMLNPRLALLFEYWGTGKQLDAIGTTMFFQHLVMVAAQYWVSPRLWLKGGLGFSHLSWQYDDGYVREDEPVADGGALMGALGYEIVTGHKFALDVQLRLGAGTYEGLAIGDQIQVATVGLGVNWY